MCTLTVVLFGQFSPIAMSMSAAGLALFVVAILATKNDIAKARDIDWVIPLTRLCIAIPLAVFGAEHLSNPQAMLAGVPPYMPWRMFWVYFVGLALIAASLSIATNIQIRWSGLFFGTMMLLFVAMLHFPNAVKTGGRLTWTIVFREMSFAGGGWVLAGIDMRRGNSQLSKSLIIAGRVLIAIAAIVFGIQHFLHPLGLPGVPLEKQMPPWVPFPRFIDFLTGTCLIIAGSCLLLARKIRIVSTSLGVWIVLMVVVIYGPVLIAALVDPRADVQVEGLNYFADTLLFGGIILSLACATRAGAARSAKSGRA